MTYKVSKVVIKVPPMTAIANGTLASDPGLVASAVGVVDDVCGADLADQFVAVPAPVNDEDAIIALNLWSFAGDSDRKGINYFMGKPFAVYSFNDKWDFLYMPYGISIYWDKPSGENIYFPVGGGFQRHLNERMNFSMQLFNNVLRPTQGTEWDLRFMFEFVLD